MTVTAVLAALAALVAVAVRWALTEVHRHRADRAQHDHDHWN